MKFQKGEFVLLNSDYPTLVGLKGREVIVLHYKDGWYTVGFPGSRETVDVYEGELKGKKDMAFYVLNPYGSSVSDVIVAGPFEDHYTAWSALSICAIADAHIELLLTRKVEAHLAEDRRLMAWLKERCFQRKN